MQGIRTKKKRQRDREEKQKKEEEQVVQVRRTPKRGGVRTKSKKYLNKKAANETQKILKFMAKLKKKEEKVKKKRREAETKTITP